MTGYGTLDDDNSDSDSTGGVVISRQRAIGSGFIIDSTGYIITNAHVVKGAQRVQIVLSRPSGDMSPTNSLTYRSTVLPARIIGVATDVDLAVLKVEAKDLPTIPVQNLPTCARANLCLRSAARKAFAIP